MSFNTSMTLSNFFALHPRLQDGIAHTLGWSSLRLVQEQTIEAVLQGSNCIVLAPTAGGKTEAAFFPILDSIIRDKLAPICALYISPIRALLNNQEPRLEVLSRLVGATVFKWHGDVSYTARRRFLMEPSHILMTTPESLEVMLISPRVDKTHLFAGLRFMVIDEIHNFAAGDRGSHLMAVLERLAHYTKFDIQRIGLSATVGNPEDIGAWMQGSSQRSSIVIDPPKQSIARLIRIDSYEDEKELARLVTPLARGRKTLFFVEGRRLAEGVKQALTGVTAMSYVHHSSVGQELREEAEAAFSNSQESQCIICTSTMELGIDVGDLDAVLQLDAPITVSSFLQRMGRTGRRLGSQAEMDFFCADDMALVRAVALVNLARRSWIESVNPDQCAFHILIHQILAQALQFAGVRRALIWNVVCKSSPFHKIKRSEFDRIIDHLLHEHILYDVDGLLVIGEVGEKRYGRKNFLALYSVFETPEEVSVLTTDRREIGTLQMWFVRQIGTKEFIFVLAGRSWQVTHLDLDHAEVIVTPAPKGAVPHWGGGGPLLSRKIAEEIRSILITDMIFPFLTKRAQLRLNSLRAQWRDVLQEHTLTIQQKGSHWILHTFAGDRINLLLARILELLLGCKVIGDSFSVALDASGQAQLRKEVLSTTLHQICQPAFFSPQYLSQLTEGMQRGQLSKFQPLLPQDLEAQFLATRLFDIDGLLDVLKPQFS